MNGSSFLIVNVTLFDNVLIVLCSCVDVVCVSIWPALHALPACFGQYAGTSHNLDVACVLLNRRVIWKRSRLGIPIPALDVLVTLKKADEV